MRKIAYSFFLFMSLFFSSCSEEYDDTDLRNDITDLENRVQALEELCKNMNTNISSLQTLVDALQSNDYITKITPIVSEGKEIGYNIEFLRHEPIVIYHGKDGEDGKDGINGITPQLKIENNYWYVSYDNGNSWQQLHQATVPMPQMKIENNYWYISYDNGASWQQLGKATGEDGTIPQLKIVDGYWYVSYDYGENWQQLDKATGENGKDGQTPQFKIQDNYWYVSYDGGASWELLHDSNNNSVSMPIFKIEDGYWLVSYDAGGAWTRLGKAQGDTGDAGNTPQFKIENDYWYVSYDNGSSWQQLGRATGKNGSNGLTPEIGIKKDTDGIYYWTLDGEWLLDDNGQKIKAQGTDGADGEDGADGQPGNPGNDGKDGITPQLKIENDYWYVSYDNGASWTQLGKATSSNENFIFEEVDNSNDDYVIFKLSNGETFNIPKCKSLDILFEETKLIAVVPDVPLQIPYTLIGATSETQVEAIGTSGIKVKTIATNPTEGYIEILATDEPDEYSRVIVFLIEGERTITRTLTFSNGYISIVKDTYEIDYRGGTITIPLESNLNFSCKIEEGSDWVSTIYTRASYNISFSIAQNDGFVRSAVIAFTDKSGKVQEKIMIYQGAASPSQMITVNGEEATIYIGGAYDIIQINDAIKEAENKGATKYIVKGISEKFELGTGNPFRFAKNMKSIDLSNLINYEYLPGYTFSASGGIINGDTPYFQALEEVILPETITEIGPYSFNMCRSLKSLVMPGVLWVGRYAFYKCYLPSIELSKAWMIDEFAFESSNIPSVNIPAAEEIRASAFVNSKLEYLSAPNVTILGFSGGTADNSDLGKILHNCNNLKTVKFTTKSQIKSTSGLGTTTLGNFNSEQCVLYLNNSMNDNSLENKWMGKIWKEIIFVD